jgi:quercetin dioxygenase-like cupin family protein
MCIHGKLLTAVGFLLLPSVVATASAQQDDKPIVQNTPPGQFQKIPNLPDCITAAVEQGDPTKGASVLLVKGASGCKAPWHFHTPNEQVMMLSGVGRVEMKGEPAVSLRAGGFAYAPVKHVHQFTCVGGPCSFFLHSDAPFDIHYVDQGGNEISSEQALSKRHS